MGVTNLDSLTLGGDLIVGGTQTVTGNITYAGDVTLGDDYTDEVEVNGIARFIRESDGANGYKLTLEQESASPAVNDAVGFLNYDGYSDGASLVSYASVRGVIADATDGAEKGQLQVRVQDGSGSIALAAMVQHTGSNGMVVVGDGASEGKFISAGEQDVSLATGGSKSGEIVVLNGADAGVEITPDGDGATYIGGGIIHQGLTTSSGPGAIPVTGRIHELTSTGAGDAMTLADGSAGGQRFTILYVAEGAGGDTAVITPANLVGGTTITLNALGDSAELVFGTNGWYVVGLGGTAAVA